MMPVCSEWRWLVTPPASASWNMAFDEALLLHANSRGTSVLRFYSWIGNPATFGYFQHIEDIERMTSDRPLVRRCSGGGLVPHTSDWTYSVAVPVSDPWWGKPAEDSYRDIHQWCVHALGSIGFSATLAPAPDMAGPGQCFVGAEKNDILFEGRKIGGAAQRRNRDGLLIQGSIQCSGTRLPGSPSDWIQAMIQSAPVPVSANPWDDWQQDTHFTDRVGSLANEKYGSDQWNRRR